MAVAALDISALVPGKCDVSMVYSGQIWSPLGCVSGRLKATRCRLTLLREVGCINLLLSWH